MKLGKSCSNLNYNIYTYTQCTDRICESQSGKKSFVHYKMDADTYYGNST